MDWMLIRARLMKFMIAEKKNRSFEQSALFRSNLSSTPAQDQPSR